MNVCTQVSFRILVLLQFVVFSFTQSGLSELNLSRTVRQATNTCVLPPHPDNGRWSILGLGQGRPGDEVNLNSVLKYECHPGYKLSSKDPYVICDNGWSVRPLPKCQKLCPALYSTSTTTLNCFNILGEKINCHEATHDSYLKHKCIPYYEAVGSTSIYCNEGTWTSPPPVCKPICGRKVGDDAIKLVYTGTPLKTIKYPWIVAIYWKDQNIWRNICGGNIISTRFILTAAHCVTNDYGDPHPVENYQVAAAKLYNKYGDVRDKEANYLEVLHIVPYPEFNGESRRFLGDLAIIVTKIQFRLGPLIQPVCISGVDQIYLLPGDIGEVAGWGTTENGLPSDELRFIEIPYKHPDVCKKELPVEWEQKYNFRDKFCAGIIMKNTSVCTGDSGSGLVFKNPDNNRYYIHGIVSIAPTKNGTCDIQQNALYTKVAHYHDFIDLQLTKNSGECRLPNYPPNGKWFIENDPKKVPGDSVSSDQLLRIECNEGYAVSSGNATIDCESARFRLPVCSRLCPPLISSKNTIFKCTDRKGSPIDCTKATQGSVLSYECASFYEQKVGQGKSIVCDDGVWNSSSVDCQPVCGKPIDISQLSNQQIDNLEYPWVTAIYENMELINKSTENENYEFICVGTLISTNVIMTAAHCTTDSNGKSLVGKKSYKVAAAKFYRHYKDSREKLAQYLDVSESFATPNYRGVSQNYLGNIAILITKGRFTLGPLIQPICFKYVNEIKLTDGAVGLVTGWGSKTNSSLSDELVSLEVPYKSKEQCDQELPAEFAEIYYYKDKLCAGHYKKQKFICRGDGGSGLVIKNPKDGRFYIHGIASLAPLIEENCDPDQNALYTNVQSYFDTFLSVTFRKYEESCRLPVYPENGKWAVKGSPDKAPGDLVAPIDILQFECSEKYNLVSRLPEVMCQDSHHISKCEKMCPLPFSTSKAILKCTDRYGDNIDCLEATEGAALSYECRQFYEPEDDQKEKVFVCSNGSWNVTTIVCQPICGKEKESTDSQINTTSKFPWIVAIYRKEGQDSSVYGFVCGGTLISRNLILSSAFCVSNSRGSLLKEKYFIGAGKYFRKYRVEEGGQFLEVNKVIIHPDYKGESQNYFGNLAILQTKELFELSPYVQPVCIKNLKKIEEERLSTSNFKPGVISGWGTKKDDLLSETLIDLEIPYKSESICLEELPSKFYSKYYSNDKLCAGLYQKDKGVCNGDAGSGLMYKNPKNSRYYVHGIVSLTPKLGSICDIRQNTLYTKVSFVYEFIIEQMDEYSREYCELPVPPVNGRWTSISGQDINEKKSVSSNEVLTVTCNDGFALDPLMSTTTCNSTFTISECYVVCPALSFPPGSRVLCKNKKDQETDCSKPIEGTRLTFSCPSGYSALPGTSTKLCNHGTWMDSNSTCMKNIY